MEVLASRTKRFIGKVNDIILLKEDILVIILKDDKEIEGIKKEFKDYNLKFININDLLKKKEVLEILYDGFSLKYDSPINKKVNFEPLILITYGLENLDHIKKTMFGYALKGRSEDKGLLGTIKETVIGRNSFIIPIKNLEKIKEFFEHWNVKYKTKKIIEVK